jgi:hypothetical protein
MNHLNIRNPDDLLLHQENPKIIQNQIIEYIIQLKNPPHSLRYATRSQYLAAVMTLSSVSLVISGIFSIVTSLSRLEMKEPQRIPEKELLGDYLKSVDFLTIGEITILRDRLTELSEDTSRAVEGKLQKRDR